MVSTHAKVIKAFYTSAFSVNAGQRLKKSGMLHNANYRCLPWPDNDQIKAGC
jgi:hypothetical protein